VDEALKRATALRSALRGEEVRPESFELAPETVEVLHALGLLLEQDQACEPEAILRDCGAAFRFVESLDWADGVLGGRQEVLSRLAFLCWRNARRAEKPAEERKWVDVHGSIFRRTAVFSAAQPVEEVRSVAERVLAMPIPERAERAQEWRLDDPELLLCICEVLRSRSDTSPASVRDDAEFFYLFLDQPRRNVGLCDEREYFLGEMALIAGTACRLLFRRGEARRWFDRAESVFVLTANGLANVARLSYQRLALHLEERQFEEVLELTPRWFDVFTKLELAEDAVKCRFLEGVALREVGKVSEAIEVFRDICSASEALGNVKLLAQAATGLAQFYRILGDFQEALSCARKALPLLQQLENRVTLAKLRWTVGSILREQGNLGEAVEAYRAALQESEEIGTRGDTAAIHLVLADVLLDAGFDRQAEWEIRAALPIIEEEKMVPEGFAALALLQESLRRRTIDRQALRNLHGYFRDQA
jgi:tetratricopeptide (TPR) repeat protein